MAKSTTRKAKKTTLYRHLLLTAVQYSISLSFIALYNWANGAIKNSNGGIQTLLAFCLSLNLIMALYFVWQPKLSAEALKTVVIEVLKVVIKVLS